MSVTESTAQHAEASDHGDGHVEHPSDWLYAKVALVLGVLTGIEVFTYFESVLDWGKLLMPLLIVLMGIKFYLIAAYFMHLKYDPKILRRAFLVGILLALGVYLIMLIAFEFFAGWS
jgi:cytochrome c oxidase subunit 4